jgi:hypothetical protein
MIQWKDVLSLYPEHQAVWHRGKEFSFLAYKFENDGPNLLFTTE